MIFVVRRGHAKCTAFNLQRKLLPIFIKPPKGFGDGSEARLFLDTKENIFYLLHAHISNNSFRKKIHLHFRLSAIPWNEPSSTESLERSDKVEFSGSSNPREVTGAPQSCHHPSPDQGRVLGSSIPNRNNLASPLPADTMWKKNRASVKQKPGNFSHLSLSRAPRI